MMFSESLRPHFRRCLCAAQERDNCLIWDVGELKSPVKMIRVHSRPAPALCCVCLLNLGWCPQLYLSCNVGIQIYTAVWLWYDFAISTGPSVRSLRPLGRVISGALRHPSTSLSVEQSAYTNIVKQAASRVLKQSRNNQA